MKKYLIICLISIVGFFSCEEDPIIFDTPEGFVQLASSSASIAEDATDPIVLTVQLGDGSNPNGVNVDFSVTSSDNSRFTVTPSDGTLTIPAGEFTGEIIITPIDNLDVDGNLDVTVELLESSDVPIGIAGEGNFRTTFTASIIDNDCPTELSTSYTGRVFAFGAEAPSFNVTLVPIDGTDNQFSFTTLWGPTFVSWATGDSQYDNRFLYSGVITLNEDFSIDVAGDSSWATGGTGSYASCDDAFSFTLTQALFTSAFTVDVVLTGN